MNKYDMKKIVEETLIEYIAEKVAERLININKKAIVIFTGASIGFSQSIESLRSLQSDGWELEVILSKGAEKALTVDLIKDLLQVDNVITEDKNIDTERLLSRNKLMLVPALTINTASKIANCISDNLVTNLISRFIMEGKPIIASINGCCPDNKERHEMGFLATEAYKARLRQNIETMREFGINLTISENLYVKTNRIFLRQFNMSESKSTKDTFLKTKAVNINSRVVTQSTILENAMFDTLNLRKDSIITDLAKEEAKRRKIKLIK